MGEWIMELLKPQLQTQTTTPSTTSPSQMQEAVQSMASLTKLLLEVSNYLNVLKREFRGEAMYQSEDGRTTWVQVTKPVFIRVDFKSGKPIKMKEKMPWGNPPEEKEVYIPNDEAIDEILSMLKFSGINQISPIGFNQPANYLDDLKEFECKLAAVLCLKQKEWGMDKELLPMYQFKIKTIIQDVRSMSVNGNTLKSLISTVQRVEQFIEGGENKTKKVSNSPFG
jgi:hypothetical protein